MKTCPDCGSKNMNHDEFCTHCGADLKHDNYTLSNLPETSSTQENKADSEDTEVYMTKKDLRYFGQIQETKRIEQGSRIAAVFSFIFPGLGQMSAGKIGKGILFFIGWVLAQYFYISWCIRALSKTELYSWQEPPGLGTGHIIVGIVLIIGWVLNIVDAYYSVE